MLLNHVFLNLMLHCTDPLVAMTFPLAPFASCTMHRALTRMATARCIHSVHVAVYQASPDLIILLLYTSSPDHVYQSPRSPLQVVCRYRSSYHGPETSNGQKREKIPP
ncbi:hypothetical protein ABZX51_005262 [Aspergillus tubingensis]